MSAEIFSDEEDEYDDDEEEFVIRHQVASRNLGLVDRMEGYYQKAFRECALQKRRKLVAESARGAAVYEKCALQKRQKLVAESTRGDAVYDETRPIRGSLPLIVWAVVFDFCE